MARKYSILVIDDQENWRGLLKELLEDQFDVKTADSYANALKTIRKQKIPFHVVVTDMRLDDSQAGNQEGLKLIEYLNKRGDETKTIVVTGYATIATAVRALSELAASAYLEKTPADGSLFDVNKFRDTIYHAAEEAEARRPHGITDTNVDILLLEPDPALRKKIGKILIGGGYSLTSLETDDDIVTAISNNANKYRLILINESLSSEKLLASLHRSFQDARMIVLTSRNLGNILKIMRDYPVMPFSMSGKNFSPIAFREFIHSALAYGAMKYVTLKITSENKLVLGSSHETGTYELIINKPYCITLSIQDKPTENAYQLWLSPGEETKGKISLHVFIRGDELTVEPGTEINWEIPRSRQRPQPCQFTVTPKASGRKKVMVEISQDERLMARISLSLWMRE